MFLENRINPIWESHHGKGPFIRSLPLGGRIMDIGCGNNSPSYVKNMRPDLYYIGIDVGDYNQDDVSLISANEYHVSTTSQFSANIERLELNIDGVVSSHNLEHCNDCRAVLRAMVGALKPGGGAASISSTTRHTKTYCPGTPSSRSCPSLAWYSSSERAAIDRWGWLLWDWFMNR